jgi:hypothetical protein
MLQVEKSPKPVASCAMPAGPGMKIKTDTPLVKKAREGVMEFLLVREGRAQGSAVAVSSTKLCQRQGQWQQLQASRQTQACTSSVHNSNSAVWGVVAADAIADVAVGLGCAWRMHRCWWQCTTWHQQAGAVCCCQNCL